MKKIIYVGFVIATTCFGSNIKAQKMEPKDSLGLPGDNLDLAAVLELFQGSATFEEFEKKLNEQDSKINNLDLNNDSKTDYIKVVDHKDGDSHNTVLQVAINEKETQDVAVIEIDKDKEGKIVLQIVGNEELYGKDYIIEPIENDPSAKKKPVAQSAHNKKGIDTIVDTGGKTVINKYTTNNYYTDNGGNYSAVSSWPMVHYMYSPTYVVYVSPWYWSYYPIWWQPWSPWYWHDYHWHHHHHYGYHYYGYQYTNYYRAPIAHRNYSPHRSVSVTVHNHRASNVYNSTYARRSPVRVSHSKPGTANPGFKERPASNNSQVKNKPTSGKISPSENNGHNNVSRPNGSRQAPKSEPRQNYNKAPKQHQNVRSAPKEQKRSAGGKKR